MSVTLRASSESQWQIQFSLHFHELSSASVLMSLELAWRIVKASFGWGCLIAASNVVFVLYLRKELGLALRKPRPLALLQCRDE